MMKVIATDRAPGAIGPYSQGYVAGGFVYTSGQIPVDPETGKVVSGGSSTPAGLGGDSSTMRDTEDDSPF